MSITRAIIRTHLKTISRAMDKSHGSRLTALRGQYTKWCNKLANLYYNYENDGMGERKKIKR